MVELQVQFIPLIELMQSADQDKYLLNEPVAIFSLLHLLKCKQTLITGIFSSRNDVIPTTILELENGKDPARLLLDAFGNPEVNARIAESGKIRCATQLDGVRIQFRCHNIELIEHEGKKAFRADMPDSILRVQRREFYRLTAPISANLHARIRLPTSNDVRRAPMVNLPVIDISGGGMALLIESDGLTLAANQEFRGCHIALPDGGHIHATLKVRNVFRLTDKDGATVHRAGCQFVDLPASQQGMIQRFVMRAERDRKARETGFA